MTTTDDGLSITDDGRADLALLAPNELVASFLDPQGRIVAPHRQFQFREDRPQIFWWDIQAIKDVVLRYRCQRIVN